jgi:hypothetical protein
LFNEKFPQNLISRYYLRLIYKRFGITQKVPLTWNCNKRRYDLSKLDELREDLDLKMRRFERLGYTVVQIDECTFTQRNEGLRKIWSLPKHHIKLLQQPVNKNLAGRSLMGAISQSRGYILCHIIKGYFDS